MRKPKNVFGNRGFLFSVVSRKLHRVMSIFKKLSLIVAFWMGAGVAMPVFAEPAPVSSQTQPVTCVPASREHIAWWKQQNAGFNAVAKERNAKIVFLGDSITDGWRKAGKAVWDAQIAPLDAVNFGISGDKTENILWRLDSGNLSGKMNPKLVVLMIGTNNWQNSPDDTAKGVEAILEKIKATHPKTKILLLAVFPRGADKTDAKRQTNEKLNAKIKTLADRRRVFWLDINKVFLEKGKAQTLPRSIMPDLLHPNAEGYSRWADAVLPEIKRLAR